mmetsp:Transcript_32539/g.67864  ORF Transcript_32539/g.67864 Transcript_32539/m.67864 type:complete len:134 (-) Transcript_32539:293-694(-)|eukprot:CAMPEP_0172463532 /NCGR_PEP_ID=MMETSP1065-20121228/47541_1 /TAXON_ID=265537 /ORGANISM="Amphiprora paludosa, Strain CCMP125" /LENGTH=133 /DNA_ID=CAMNT_0013219507 /DNA_START=159 /DNA_END=560 /DNA_ORIENTATION=+
MSPARTPADPNKQLMIKAKTCQRIRKEVDYYLQEVKENEEQLQQMKDDQKDPYDIKKFEEVLGESRMMVPDSHRRLEAAVEDLSSFLEASAPDLTDEEWKTTAQQILEKEKSGTSDEAAPSTNVDGLAEGEAF